MAERRSKDQPPPSRFARLRAAFPGKRLRADLRRRGLSIRAAAAQPEKKISPDVVSNWIHRKRAPSATVLRRFLEANGIDRQPYEPFLLAPVVQLVCPNCGRLDRELERGRLKHAGMRARGRTGLRQRPDGTYERLCSRCAHTAVGRKALKKINDALVERRLPFEGPSILEAAREGDLESENVRRHVLATEVRRRLTPEARERWRAQLRQPKSEVHRRSLSVARLRDQLPKKEFYLCPLCGLATYETRWHAICEDTWRSWAKWSRWHPRMLPPMLRRRGPSVERYLKRNYCWTVAHRVGGQKRAELVKSGPASRSRWAVNEAMQSLIRVLPGSWDFVFSDQRSRHANETRQQYIPLPLTIGGLVNAGERDSLIRRLHSVEMAERDIARLTGASIDRVRGIIKTATSNASA
jgi:hypothetical protein